MLSFLITIYDTIIAMIAVVLSLSRPHATISFISFVRYSFVNVFVLENSIFTYMHEQTIIENAIREHSALVCLFQQQQQQK